MSRWFPTLATEVHLTTPTSSVRMRDVSIKVFASARRGRTTIDIGYARDHKVEVTLTEAERISLIEALGGRHA